jgi:glycosyltransferase involved in cell wall biosynthesis
MDLAIVIPAYNEARTIRGIAEQALRQTDRVIIVDDGSADGTSEALAGLPVVLVRHCSNLGKAAALWDGFRVALDGGADFMATLDGDGQHLPADIARLMRVARRYPDRIVIGARLRTRANAPLARRCANGFADFWISWAAGYPIADSQSGERVYPASLLRHVQARHDQSAAFTLESELLILGARLGYECVSVPIATIYESDARASHFQPARDIPRIGALVARSLFAQRMHPRGLWNSLRSVPAIVDESAAIAAEAADGKHDSVLRKTPSASFPQTGRRPGTALRRSRRNARASRGG